MTKLAPVQYGTSKNPSILFSMILVRYYRFVLSQLKMILDLSKKSNSNSFNSLMSKMRLRKFLISAETFETFPKNLEGNTTKFEILINCFYL